jgi:hypothetical protein
MALLLVIGDKLLKLPLQLSLLLDSLLLVAQLNLRYHSLSSIDLLNKLVLKMNDTAFKLL